MYIRTHMTWAMSIVCQLTYLSSLSLLLNESVYKNWNISKYLMILIPIQVSGKDQLNYKIFFYIWPNFQINSNFIGLEERQSEWSLTNEEPPYQICSAYFKTYLSIEIIVIYYFLAWIRRAGYLKYSFSDKIIH